MRLLQSLVTIYILFYQFWTIVVHYGTNIIKHLFTNLRWFGIELPALFYMAKNHLWQYHWHTGNIEMAIIAKMQRKCLPHIIIQTSKQYYYCTKRAHMPLPPPITTTRAQHNLKYMHMQSTSRIYRYSFPRTIP